MTQDHPITPPPELVQQWGELTPWTEALAQAARWGADQELEAWCDFMGPFAGAEIRAARRPKPPRLKERALEALETEGNGLSVTAASVIRRALESLPD